MLTAGGDDIRYYALLYEAFNAAGCDVTELKLFPQPSADPVERLGGSDLVWVGGGSVANLLALWDLHGVSPAMRAAWESGVILGGVSAGSICWHVGGTTDSFGPTLRPVTNGSPSSLTETASTTTARPSDALSCTSWWPTAACLPLLRHRRRRRDLVRGTVPARVVSDREADPLDGPAAYCVQRVGAAAVETRLPVGTRIEPPS